MRKILITLPLLLGLGSAGVAMAQDAAPAAPQNYPVCSRTVQDECVNPSQAAKAKPAKAMHRHHHHH